ncbi:MAG: hypothetical protein ACRD20_02325 [Terriglobales bacterium]
MTFAKRQSMRYGIFLILALTTACIHKTGSTSITPWERVTTDNALFAQMNNSIEQGTEAVVFSGLLTPAEGAPVIGFTAQVAAIHQQITALLGNGPNLSAGNLGTIRTLIAQVESSGTVLVNSGALGIKNPKSQQSIATDIQSLTRLASDLLTDIQAAQSAGGAQ